MNTRFEAPWSVLVTGPGPLTLSLASNHAAKGRSAGGRADVGLGVRRLPIFHQPELVGERREGGVAQHAAGDWIEEPARGRNALTSHSGRNELHHRCIRTQRA